MPTVAAAPPALAPLAAMLAKAGTPPTRHALGRACHRLTGRSLRQCPPRLLAAAVKRARKAGTLAAVAAFVGGGR